MMLAVLAFDLLASLAVAFLRVAFALVGLALRLARRRPDVALASATTVAAFTAEVRITLALAAITLLVVAWRLHAARSYHVPMDQPLLAQVPTKLYYYHDDKGKLLYVGISIDQLRRLQQHAGKDGSWVPDAGVLKWITLPNRQAALDKERQEIRRHRPPFNIAHNGARAS